MKLALIAQALGCSLPPGVGERDVSGIAEPGESDESNITFVANPKFIDAVTASASSVVIVRKGQVIPGKILLEVDDPYVGYARVAQLFEDRSFLFDGPIHPTASIHPSARVAASACVGPFVVVGRNCTIGANTRVNAHCVIENNSRIGADCLLNSRSVICRGSLIGDRVIIEAGAVIGSEGFGNAREGDSWVRIPSLGAVVIEDDVWIGANTTIDRGALGSTILRRGTRVDNLVHIAHNVEIGENCAFAAQVGVSGSTKFGNGVIVGGQAGFVGHIEIGDKAFVGAQAGVSKGVKAGAQVTGYPARDFMTQRRIDAAAAELPALVKDVRRLKKDVEELQGDGK